MGVQVIGTIRAGGIFTLAGARCSEVKTKEEEEEEEKRDSRERERGIRNLRSLRCDFWSKRAFLSQKKMERRKLLQRKPNLLLGEQRRENSCSLESNHPRTHVDRKGTHPKPQKKVNSYFSGLSY